MTNSTITYRCLSVVFPSGSYIANGDKTIEVRRWIPDVHHDEDILIIENRQNLSNEGQSDKKGVARALVKIKEIRPWTQNDVNDSRVLRFADGNYAWILDDIRPVTCQKNLTAARDIYDLTVELNDIEIFDAYSESEIKLCLPYANLKEPFVEGCLAEAGDTFEVQSQIRSLQKDFSGFVKRRLGYINGEKVSPGFVPWTEFWIMFKNECIGIVSFRHHLTPALEKLGGHVGYAIRPPFRKKGFGTKALAQALERLRVYGIREALVTCDDTNIGSYKIIEANGGQLIDRINNQNLSAPTRRYKIKLSD